MGGLVSQGLGTSMLQMGNIVKNPRIWIAPTLASAITGPLATCVFHLEMNGAAVSSGMGTCGLVGQIGVYTGWVSDIAAGAKTAITPMDWAAMVLRVLCSARRAERDLLRGRAEAGLDQRGRSEAELKPKKPKMRQDIPFPGNPASFFNDLSQPHRPQAAQAAGVVAQPPCAVSRSSAGRRLPTAYMVSSI